MLFAGLTEMFCSPSNAEQNSFVPETQISRPEMNASEESGMFYCVYILNNDLHTCV